MTYGNEDLSAVAREIKQFIYDATIYETSPQPLKGDAEWWAGQLGTELVETREALEELVGKQTLIGEGTGASARYIYVPMTVVSPELHGE